VGSGARRVAVIGPTASGKSAVAMAVARRVPPTELVSVDAMQVYRGMDIGTAKPSAAERGEVRHHLVDLVEPSDDFTVAEFQRHYERVRLDLDDREVPAVLVGGTGLYHRAVIDGLTLPGEWPAIRTRLEHEAVELGTPALHARLAVSDPIAASRMEPSNTRRVVRALEVYEGSGRPFSSFGPGLSAYPPSEVAQVGLRWPREALARRIDARVRSMVDAGLLAEVERLHAVGLSRTAAQALGYKEMIEHLEGRVGFAEAVEMVIVRTRQLAVRQLRWFGRDPRVRWVDVGDDPVSDAAPLVEALLTG
jgi:tRNA dimethylallyltransferase